MSVLSAWLACVVQMCVLFCAPGCLFLGDTLSTGKKYLLVVCYFGFFGGKVSLFSGIVQQYPKSAEFVVLLTSLEVKFISNDENSG